MPLDAKIPGGPLAEKWDRHLFELKLVNPANKRKYDIIVVGTGLAGGYFFQNLAATGEAARYSLFSGGSMPLMNLALGLKVASALFLVFTVLTALHITGARLAGGENEEDEP